MINVNGLSSTDLMMIASESFHFLSGGINGNDRPYLELFLNTTEVEVPLTILRDLQIVSPEPTQLGTYQVNFLLAQGIPKIMKYKVFYKYPKEKVS